MHTVDATMFKVKRKGILSSDNFMYIIKSGQCKLIKKVMRKNQFDRMEYKKEFVMLIGEGEIFGEGSMLNFVQNFTVVVHS